MSELGLSEKRSDGHGLEPGYADAAVTSRLDTFLSEDGFAFLEYNSRKPGRDRRSTGAGEAFHTGAGCQQIPRRNTPLLPSAANSVCSESLDHAYRVFGGHKEKPNIAIVDWDGVSTGAEFEILKEHFESEKYATQICDPSQLDYQDGRLRAGNFEIDVFYKRVIIHEFLERFDEQHPVYRACLDGAVCMANSFRSKIAHKKACFAILTDDRYHRLFSTRELATIRAHAPWTRVVRPGMTAYQDEKVDLIDQIRSTRQRFVLKPNDDYGGKGIHIGWETSESEWDDAIEEALRSPYVVQERVPVERTDMPGF